MHNWLKRVGGGRLAERNHPAAVARLQEQIGKTRHVQQGVPTMAMSDAGERPISAVDIKNATWQHHSSLLARDELQRAGMPGFADVTAEYERVWSRIDSGEIGIGVCGINMFNSQTEYELMVGAAEFLRHHSPRLLRKQIGLQ